MVFSIKLLFKYLHRFKLAFRNLDDCKAVTAEEEVQAKRLKLFHCVTLTSVVLVKSCSLSVPQFHYL